MSEPRFIHADPRVVARFWDGLTPSRERIRAAIAIPAKNVLVAKQWCPDCAAMTDHANLCPGCYPPTGGSHMGQSGPCPQCHDQIQEADAYRQWCVDCGHEGAPYPTYEQDGQTLLDQPDERAMCVQCGEPIYSPPVTHAGAGPLHDSCALGRKMRTLVQDCFAGRHPLPVADDPEAVPVPADADEYYHRVNRRPAF